MIIAQYLVEGSLMKSMGVQDLTARMNEVLQDVQNGETIEVTNQGKVVALVVPPHHKLTDEEIEAALQSVDSLAARIGAHWPEGITALQAVQDVRREL